MKTKLLLAVILSLNFCLLTSQIPHGFNYQAVAINNLGTPIANTALQVKIAILSDLVPGTVVWEELHSMVQTNAIGLFTLVIGSGLRQSGVSSFADINWAATPLYLRSQIYYNSEWKNMGSAQLWTVPYAMVADDLSGTLKKLAVTGETSPNEDALFEVKNKNGQTIFAVYNEGVRVYVSDGNAKGVKGGFAIGGFDDTKGTIQDIFIVNSDSIRAYIDDNGTGKGVKGGFAIGGFDDTKALTQNYLKVSPDSIRLYVDNNPSVKGVKGGFAIGGFDDTKGTKQDLLTVSSDSTRIYVDNTPLTKGVKGGFAIGGFDNTKGNVTPFTSLTPDNYFIGHNSGIKNKSGLYNSFLGYETGSNNEDGSNNIFLGYQSGFTNTVGSYNVMLGYKAGYTSDASYNTFLGYQSGMGNTEGEKNVYIGNDAGLSNTRGYNNVFLGYRAGYNNTDGSENVFLGEEAGLKNTYGSANTFIGLNAGHSNTEGVRNVFLGWESGISNTTGQQNVFIGDIAGYRNTTGLGNVCVGPSAGYGLSTGYLNICIGSNAGGGVYPTYDLSGWRNIFIGPHAGSANTTGEDNIIVGTNGGDSNTEGKQNIFIGLGAGSQNTTGNDNIVIGCVAGATMTTSSNNVIIGQYAGIRETGSNLLIIESSPVEKNTGLLWGDFNSDRLVINGNSGSNINNRTFYVNGEAGGSSAWWNDSDRRLKHDIVTIPDALQKVLNLRGVNFIWNQPAEGMEGLQMGFVGQEVAEIVPEVVSTSNDHYSMQYAPITALLVEAMKEQQTQIENQQKKIDELTAIVNSLANQTLLSNK